MGNSCVFFSTRPILGEQVDGGTAEGIHQGAQCFIGDVAHEAARDGVAHEQHDGRDERGHGGAHQHGHRENDGR
jgi:hypothetical protein